MQWGCHFCSSPQHTTNAFLGNISQVLCVAGLALCVCLCLMAEHQRIQFLQSSQCWDVELNPQSWELWVWGAQLAVIPMAMAAENHIPVQLLGPPALQQGRAEAQCCLCFPARIPACSSVVG